MTDMKCPFCGEKLVKWIGYADCRFWTCYNVLCEAGRFGHIADECIWQELIRTRKALDVAKDTIRHANWFFDGDYNVDAKTMHNEIKCAIKGITALEQKDVK